MTDDAPTAPNGGSDTTQVPPTCAVDFYLLGSNSVVLDSMPGTRAAVAETLKAALNTGKVFALVASRGTSLINSAHVLSVSIRENKP